MGGMESCVSQHYVTPGATSLPMGEYVQVPPDMGGHPCTPAMSSYLESLPPGVGMPEYPWMKEKKTVRKPAQQGESPTTRRPLSFVAFRSFGTSGRGGTGPGGVLRGRGRGVCGWAEGGRETAGRRPRVFLSRRPGKPRAALGGLGNGALWFACTCTRVSVCTCHYHAYADRTDLLITKKIQIIILKERGGVLNSTLRSGTRRPGGAEEPTLDVFITKTKENRCVSRPDITHSSSVFDADLRAP